MKSPDSAVAVPDDQQSAGGAAVLTARDVTVAVDGVTLVRPTSLVVAAGRLTAIIGPSGAGKTSLLRALGGVLEPSSGTVVSESVAFVPSDDLLHDELTVFEELSFAARLRAGDGGREDLVDRVMDVIGDLRLTELVDHRVATLSRGQRRRTSVAVELVGRPRALLLDEPAAGLDPGLERRLMEMLRRLADDGQGVLVATHSTASLFLCDVVVAMAPGGTVRYSGPPDGLAAAFGVDSIEAVYEQLDLGRRDDLGADGTAPRHSAPKRAPAPTVPMARQLPVILSRTATCRMRDTRTLMILIGQAPIIGLAMALVLPRGTLTDTAFGGFYGILISFMILVASIWLGTIAASREIVKDRPIIERELAIGVRPGAQVLAKYLTLLPVVTIQCALLVGVVLLLQPVEGGAPIFLGMCVATGWAAAAMGLALSCWARNPDQATTSVPLLLIPQLLFAGALIPIDRMLEPLQIFSNVILGRWALGGMGGALDLDERVGGLTSVTGLDPGFFAGSPATPLLAMAGIGAFSLLLAAQLLRRPSAI